MTESPRAAVVAEKETATMTRMLLLATGALACVSTTLLVALGAAAQTAPMPPQASVAPAAAPPPAAAPAPAPPTGLWWLLGGSGLTVGGAADLALTPLCLSSRVPSSQHPACIGTSIGVGVALLGAGIPLLVVGAQKRSAFLTWQRLQRVGVAPVPGGAAVSWVGTF